jgi:hypothetical protein
MARGLKISHYQAAQTAGAPSVNLQIDQASGPQTATIQTSDTTTVTPYLGGTGGDPTNVTVLTIKTGFETSNGTYYHDGFIITQRGRKQFDVQSVAAGSTSRTRATLTAASTASITASQMSITCLAPDGTQFYATRITTDHVWNGNTKYRYALANESAITYVNTNTGTTATAYKAAATIAIVQGA